ncbi:protein NEN4-like [Chenopodium quinoa]|uniref:Exonuclease domain-containing protein n=1 Tax=Chenopodium quinoa TaxID=63459 RepID=A0A803KXK5_CHEQI|nr:protein NEN4-like [Chenopodium quinoa]
MAASYRDEERVPEIVFFDIETSVPNRAGPGHERRFWILEFGAMVICPSKLVEIESYCTLIKPGDLSVVALKSTRSDGITREAVIKAPTFEEVADKIFEVLDGRIWAGHNIQRFDCLRIKEAFAEIGRPAPQPIGMIDSLGVLSDKFGRRAGDMKMASLANYFGLGQQKHRSLDDVRMNLEVLKNCATVLFLESSLPNMLSNNKLHNGSSTIITRSKNVDNKRTVSSYNKEESSSRKSPPPASIGYIRAVPYPTRASLRKMTERVKSLWCKAPSSQSINNLIKHSQSILR